MQWGWFGSVVVDRDGSEGRQVLPVTSVKVTSLATSHLDQ